MEHRERGQTGDTERRHREGTEMEHRDGTQRRTQIVDTEMGHREETQRGGGAGRRGHRETEGGRE